MQRSVLVVDDDPAVCTLIEALLRRNGYAVEIARDGVDAEAKLRRSPFDAVVLDIMLPRANGFDVLQFLKADRPAMMGRVVIVTAAADRTLRDFDWSGVRALVRKPFDIGELMGHVRACWESAEEPELRRPAAKRAGI